MRKVQPYRPGAIWMVTALLLLLVGCTGTAGAVAFTTLARGGQSGITEPKALLITDQPTWEEHWRRHAAVFLPPPPPPPVDFGESSVVAVHLGERRTGGYRLKITRIERTDGALAVTAVESRPAPGAVVTMALTQPYVMVRVPRVDAGTELQVEWLVESPAEAE